MVDTTPKFTKDDFMTAHDLVKKFDKKYDLETIQSTMASEFKRGTKIIQGSRKRELIIKPKYSHHANFYKLHPLGLEMFREILEQRGK
ncbi:MAG: hypothetical protein IJW84_03595 [Alphaproteobacteria bacterium]|nr:hypothetical protein [Alphaproteobacteria bacterium]MBQ7289949.1 hypothetical protein [Alphaproteobacteria bacterium]